MLAAISDKCSESRQFPRVDVRCRARIRIGKREYAGFIENISEGGARIVTLTPIRDSGPALLMLPDFSPIRANLRWRKQTGGGLSFCLKLDSDLLERWALTRQHWRTPYCNYVLNDALAPPPSPI